MDKLLCRFKGMQRCVCISWKWRWHV